MSTKKIATNHYRIDPAVADVHTEIPLMGSTYLSRCKVTIDNNHLSVVPEASRGRKNNTRIFKAGGVIVMTRPNGKFHLTAEIDPTEAKACALTKKLIASAIETALNYAKEQKGGKK